MNTCNLSEFIGNTYLSTDFHEILPEHSRDNDKTKVCQEIWILNIFFLQCPFMQHILGIFSLFNFRHRYLDNQTEYRKNPIQSYWLTVNHFAHVLASNGQIKFNKRTLGHFMHFLLLRHFLKEKLAWTVNYSYTSFLLMYSLLRFYSGGGGGGGASLKKANGGGGRGGGGGGCTSI